MTWEIDDDKGVPPTYEISDIPIGQLGHSEKFYYHDKLHPVPREEATRTYKTVDPEFLPPQEADLYARMRVRYGDGTMVVFAAIEKDFPDIGKFKLRGWLRRLWAGGYLDKYCMGIYMLTAQRNWRGRTNAWRGKYFGVHYRLTGKEPK